jgi:flagellar L-ring protein precursor FlgH
MNRAISILIALSLAVPALAQVPPRSNATSTLQPPPTPAQQLRAARGSLLKAGLAADPYAPGPSQPSNRSVNLFAVNAPEPRVLKKHDLITIIVREESNYSSEGKTDLKKEASVNARLNEFVRFDLSNLTIKGGGAGTTPGIDFTGKREMTGDASFDRKDVVTLRITAEVVDVKPNDTVVISARKQIKIDDEEQTIVIAGTCRAEDVSSDNTILSTQLSDLQMAKTHKGAVRDNTRRGWLTKLLDAANPF